MPVNHDNEFLFIKNRPSTDWPCNRLTLVCNGVGAWDRATLDTNAMWFFEIFEESRAWANSGHRYDFMDIILVLLSIIQAGQCRQPAAGNGKLSGAKYFDASVEIVKILPGWEEFQTQKKPFEPRKPVFLATLMLWSQVLDEVLNLVFVCKLMCWDCVHP